MHADQMAEDAPSVNLDSNALEAAQLLAERRLPALVVLNADGSPHSILPASQVVRFLVPGYVLDDPSLARVMNESMADHAGDKLGSKRVRDLLPQRTPGVACGQSRRHNHRGRSDHGPTAVSAGGSDARQELIGVISASRLLELALPAP